MKGPNLHIPCARRIADIDRIEEDTGPIVALLKLFADAVEGYIGEDGGAEGVKLEQQVLITKTGYQLLSTFPLEEQLLA